MAIVIAMTVAGCGDDGAQTGGAGGTGASAGNGGTGGVGASAGSGGTGGDGASAGNGGDGGGGDGGGGNGAGVDDSAYAGFDPTTLPSGAPPAGCLGAFDPASGALALTLGQGITSVRVGVVSDEIQANGTTCTSASGDPATTATTKSIQITGTAEDDFILVDLATGPFGVPGALLPFSIDAAGGNDTFGLRGSPAKDQIEAGQSGATFVLDLDADGAGDLQVEGAEILVASLGPGDDALRATGLPGGTPAKNALSVFGDAGNDDLQGGDGDDPLHGGAGDDLFHTSAVPDGADTYDGGDGVDELDYSARTAPLAVTFGDQANDGGSGEHDDVTATVEILYGGAVDDILVGAEGNQEIHGGPGNDVLHGGPGDDSLHGNGQNDTLYGDDGDDSLYGDDGVDTLYGGMDSDTLDGGEGSDIFDAGDGDGDICLVDAIESPAACELY